MNWKFSQKGRYLYDKENCEDGMGYIYIAKLFVMPNTFLTKIGATTSPSQRMTLLDRNLRICCISKPHYNYFENEGILHEYYEKFRIPCKPNGVNSGVRPELFNISLKEIFETMPEMIFETDLKNCSENKYANTIFYTRKESVYSPDKTTRHS